MRIVVIPDWTIHYIISAQRLGRKSILYLVTMR